MRDFFYSLYLLITFFQLNLLMESIINQDAVKDIAVSMYTTIVILYKRKCTMARIVPRIIMEKVRRKLLNHCLSRPEIA